MTHSKTSAQHSRPYLQPDDNRHPARVAEEAIAYGSRPAPSVCVQPLRRNTAVAEELLTSEELTERLLNCPPAERGRIGARLMAKLKEEKAVLRSPGDGSCRFTPAELELIVKQAEQEKSIPSDILWDTFRRMHPSLWK